MHHGRLVIGFDFFLLVKLYLLCLEYLPLDIVFVYAQVLPGAEWVCFPHPLNSFVDLGIAAHVLLSNFNQSFAHSHETFDVLIVKFDSHGRILQLQLILFQTLVALGSVQVYRWVSLVDILQKKINKNLVRTSYIIFVNQKTTAFFEHLPVILLNDTYNCIWESL